MGQAAAGAHRAEVEVALGAAGLEVVEVEKAEVNKRPSPIYQSVRILIKSYPWSSCRFI